MLLYSSYRRNPVIRKVHVLAPYRAQILYPQGVQVIQKCCSMTTALRLSYFLMSSSQAARSHLNAPTGPLCSAQISGRFKK